MKIEIIQILDRGKPESERLWLKATSDLDLMHYIVIKTVYLENNTIISNLHTSSLWFASQKIKAGDSVVIYTKSGTKSKVQNADGSTTYFIYWGLTNPLWIKIEDCAVVLEVNSWITSQPGF